MPPYFLLSPNGINFKQFLNPPFRFQRNTAEMLTRLVTYRGRLPMGTPTSPVLSNFAMRELDDQLYQLAQENELRITRFADDFSISARQEIKEELWQLIKEMIEQAGFKIHPDKVKHFGPPDIKEVTGLVLQEGQVSLPAHFIPDIEKEIEDFATIMRVQNQQGKLNTNWVGNVKKQIRGKINFVGYVLGPDSEVKSALITRLNQASYPPPEDFGSYSWRSFHYQI